MEHFPGLDCNPILHLFQRRDIIVSTLFVVRKFQINTKTSLSAYIVIEIGTPARIRTGLIPAFLISERDEWNES